MVKPDYTALTFPEPPPDRPYVAINMVMSLDGRVQLDGNEQGLGSKADQRLMRELRVHADVVLNGAQTLRASGSSSRTGDPQLEALRIQRGKSPAGIAATITHGENLPLERAFFTATDFDAVVYLAASASAEAEGRIRDTGRRVFRLPAAGVFTWMLRHMRCELGARFLLCEGGPHVNGGLFAEGLIDEFFLSLGPRVASGGAGRLSAVVGEPFGRDEAPRADLIHAVPNEETGEVYLRYRVRGDAGRSA